MFQEKQPKGKPEPNSGMPIIKTLGPKRSQPRLGSGQAVAQDSASKSMLESSEAVTQLLKAVPAMGQVQEVEWEEVVISEAHILANNLPQDDHGSATAVIRLQGSVSQAEPPSERRENEGVEKQPSAEAGNAANSLAPPPSAVKHPVG